MRSKPLSQRIQCTYSTLLIYVCIAFLVLHYKLYHSALPPDHSLLPPGPLFHHFSDTSNSKIKWILLWTNYWSSKRWPPYLFGENGGHPSLNCHHSNCRITRDRLRLPEASLVVFLCLNLVKTDLPKRRYPHQKWAFFCQESPSVVEELGLSRLASSSSQVIWWTDGLFNWTITKRRDSTIFYPLSEVVRLPQLQSESREAFRQTLLAKVKKKTKFAAWVVSHCQTEGNREAYIRQLKEFMPVDNYGDCGNLTIGSVKLGPIDPIINQYYFYLGFENAICPDYISEKYLQVLNETMAVPVVFGGGNYIVEGPPYSFVSAMVYPDPQDLAQKLLHLHKHPDKYVEYLMWKSEYRMVPDRPASCTICSLLNDNRRMAQHETIVDFSNWWNWGLNCRRWDHNIFESLLPMTNEVR